MTYTPVFPLDVDRTPGESGHDSDHDQIHTKLNAYIDVCADFGAVGDDSANDSTRIVAAITEAVGTADPTSNTRTATKGLWLPPGKTFKVDADALDLRSIMGLSFHGGGDQSTIIKSYGSGNAILSVDGAASCDFEGFTLQTDGSSTVQKGIAQFWNPANAARSTTQNAWRWIGIDNARYVRGFDIGHDGDGTQVDNGLYERVVIVGGWTDGEATLWQDGFYVGDGVFANNLLHTFLACQSIQNRNNVHFASSEMAWFGGAVGNGGIDFMLGGATSYFCVKGIRSESSQRMLSAAAGGSSPAMVSFEDVEWIGDQVASDGRWVDYGKAGVLYFQNVLGTANTVTPPSPLTIHLAPSNSVPPNIPLTFIFDGLATDGLYADTIDASAYVNVLGRGYVGMDPDSLVIEETIAEVSDAPWSTYTPTVEGTGWSLGNGTAVGRYQKNKKVIQLDITVTFGSTSTFGSGALQITWPPDATPIGTVSPSTVQAVATQSGVGYKTINGDVTNTEITFYLADWSNTVNSSRPFTWAAGDKVQVTATYEAA